MKGLHESSVEAGERTVSSRETPQPSGMRWAAVSGERVWIESWNSIDRTARVRFGKGMQSRVRKLPLDAIDWTVAR